MRRRIEEIQAHLAHHDLLILSEHPTLKHAVGRLERAGRLVRLLPGIYTDIDRADNGRLRMAALHHRDPDVVFTGMSAAGLLWDTEVPASVEACSRLACSSPGYDVRRRRIEPDWIVELADGIRVTHPALTAVDLIPREGGRFVDHLLREAGTEGAQALAQMWAAYRAHPRRPDNEVRLEVLRLSRAIPWSEAERLAHRHLQDGRFTGWRANHSVSTPTGSHTVDLVFPAVHLIIEIDGFEFHSSRQAFEYDRTRQNALVTAGWSVLRFTWAMIETGSWLADLTRFLELQSAGHLVLPS